MESLAYLFIGYETTFLGHRVSLTPILLELQYIFISKYWNSIVIDVFTKGSVFTFDVFGHFPNLANLDLVE